MQKGNGTPPPKPSLGAAPLRPSEAARAPSEPDRTAWWAESSCGEASSIDIRVCLHSLRRLWWKILIAGVCLAAPAELVLWKTVKEQYAATALIHFAPDRIVPLGDSAGRSFEAYTAYKTTIQQLVKSRVFLKAVTARSEIAGLPDLQSATDPVTWLKGKLQVEFPDRGEVMQLTAKDADPEQAVAVVNAVVEVFLAGAVDLDRAHRATVSDALEKLEQEIAKELRQSRLELARVLRTPEGSDANSALRKQQIGTQILAALDHEVLQQELELRRSASKRNVAHALDDEAEASEMEQQIEADPIASKLRLDLEQLRRAKMHDQAVCTRSAAEQAKQRWQTVAGPFEERFRQRVAELRECRRARSEAAMRELESRIAIIADQQKQLDAMLPDVAQQSGVAVDLERRKAEIQRAERALDQLRREKERLRLACGDVSRATLLDAAVRPKSPVNHVIWQGCLLMAGLGSFLLPAAIAVLWGLRTGHVYSPSDVEREAGLPVLGTLPDVPARIIRRWDQPSRGHYHLQTRLTESVDVVLNAVREQLGSLKRRTLLICSAAREEGKTIFARQLAVNLTQLGYRTLLVDFDLRRPKLHSAFHLPLDKGVGAVLRGELGALDALQKGPVENLWVATAGTWDEQTRIALNRGRMIELIEEYQPLFQVVIVLGAPLLAGVDSRLVAPHMDGVVLSVKRDVSRWPELAAAHRLLKKLKVNLLGAVLTGGRVTPGPPACSSQQHAREMRGL
jgi:polysaccharide biosynthesis transport protein